MAALPIALVWKAENKWIAAPVVLVFGLFILLQVIILNRIAEEHTGYLQDIKDERELAAGVMRIAPSPKIQKLIYYTVLALFYLLTASITFTGRKVENYLEWQLLLLDLLKLSWIPIGVAWLYNKMWRMKFDKRAWEHHVTIASFFIPLLFVFHSLVWYNCLKPSVLITGAAVRVMEKGYNTRYGTKYIFLNIDGNRKRFVLRGKLYAKIREEDSIRIRIKQGALGYAYIDSFIVAPN